MRAIVALGLGLCLAGAAHAQTKIADDSELAPVLNALWVEGSCASPTSQVDWARDKDGAIYRRDGGLTPLSGARLVDGRLVTDELIGIGLTRSEYALKDGTLRLMQETWYEDEDPSGTPTIQVKDGRRVSADGGMEQPAEETPVLTACPKRAGLFPEEIVTALDGMWVLKGGSCAPARGTVHFDLARAAPRIVRTDRENAAEGESYALDIRADNGGFVLTEGSALEASQYRLTVTPKGLDMVSADMEGARPDHLTRCAK